MIPDLSNATINATIMAVIGISSPLGLAWVSHPALVILALACVSYPHLPSHTDYILTYEIVCIVYNLSCYIQCVFPSFGGVSRTAVGSIISGGFHIKAS